MALPKIADRVQETTSTTGTGSITLLGATTAQQSFFNGIGTGNLTEFCIISGNGTDWEVNTGTLSGSGPYVLSRGTTPIASSNSGSLINLSGTSTVFCDASANYLAQLAPLIVQVGGTVQTPTTTLNLGTGITGTLSAGVVTATTVGQQPYDILIFNPGTLTNNQKVARIDIARTVVLPVSLTGSVANTATAATASATLTITNNGTSIGTVNFASSATSGTFTFASAVTLAAGNILQVTNQSAADATLADVSVTIVGTR